MKLAIALWGLAAIGLVVQGALATFVPAPYCPDLALVVLICIGLHWEGFSSGALLAALLGFAADLLAGSLLGQHALLFLCVFAGSQIAARQLNLRSVASLVATGAVVSFLAGAAMLFLSGLLLPPAAPPWYWQPDLLTRTLATALLTPVTLAIVHALTARLVDEDAGPRTQRLARTGRVA